MNEKTLERKLVTAVKQMGGLCLKFISPGFNGVPDRIILLPEGRIAFAEIKTAGLRPRPVQVKRIEQLRALGYPAYCIDTPEQIGVILDEICTS